MNYTFFDLIRRYIEVIPCGNFVIIRQCSDFFMKPSNIVNRLLIVNLDNSEGMSRKMAVDHRLGCVLALFLLLVLHVRFLHKSQNGVVQLYAIGMKIFIDESITLLWP